MPYCLVVVLRVVCLCLVVGCWACGYGWFWRVGCFLRLNAVGCLARCLLFEMRSLC